MVGMNAKENLVSSKKKIIKGLYDRKMENRKEIRFLFFGFGFLVHTQFGIKS